jgi:tetratricopeptide (TPR) repeat protein
VTWVPFLKSSYSKPATNLTASNNSNVSFNIQINGMQTSDKKIDTSAYQSLSIPDGEVMTKEGSPQMPMITKLIAIPDCGNVSISVTPSNQLQFANYNVLPVPRYDKKKLPDGSDERILVFEEDKSVYSANTDFPGKYGEIIETGYVRNQKVARVVIYPIQFSPANKSIKVFTNFNISLSFANSSSPVNKELGIFRGMMHHAALNYEPSGINASTKISDAIKNNQLSKGIPESITSGSVIRVTDLSTLKGTNAIPVDYLIITHSSLFNSNYLTTLANHRRDYNGYDVAIVQVNNAFYTSYPGNGHHYQGIRDFIDSVFNKGKANHTGDGHLGYICLVGDALMDDNSAEMLPAAYPPSNVPPKYTDLEQGGDYYYACTGGDSDPLQDVMYGRISVGNETELSNVVNKIISYEANSTGSWNNNSMFVSMCPDFTPGCDQDFKTMTEIIPSSNQISYSFRAYSGFTTSVTKANPIFGQTFRQYGDYDDPGNLCGSDLLNNWIFNQLNAANGIHTFIYEDHGDWNRLGGEGCGRKMYYLNDGNCLDPNNTNSVNNRLNNSLYTFMIFNCCETGHFDYPSGDCVAEVSLNLANKGAIGVLASTRESNTGAFGYVDKYILDAQYNNLSHIMGEAVMESKLRITDDQFRRQYNLYGDPAVNLWPTGYNISQNMTLSGTNLISENITVASGVTLTISPGANLRFAPGCSLIVNGVLNAVGTSEDDAVIFQSTSGTSAGSWGTITFDGSAASNSMLNDVNIFYGDGIKCINGANVTIQNSFIANCTNGIHIYNSQPSIINNWIVNPQQNGIEGEAAGLGLWIQGNSIIRTTDTCNYQGIIFGNNTCPDILNNYISGFCWGMYLGGGCQSNTFGSEFWTCNNRIIYNNNGVGTAWGSYTTVGEDDGTGAFNSIFNNFWYDFNTYKYSYLTCFHNYLGANPQFYADSTSDNDWDIGFTYDICSESNKSIKNNNFIANNLKKSVKVAFLEGILLEKEGKIDEAIDFYKTLIRNNDHANIVLSRLLLIKNKYSRPEITNYFESLLNNQNKYFGEIKNLLGDIYLQNNRFDDAMTAYNDAINNSPTSYYGINARFEKLFAYLHIKNDLTTASQILSDIKVLNSKEEEVQMRIQIAENLINSTNKTMEKNGNFVGGNIPKTYNLFQNYPNPFNPATTIKYQIPKPGLVTLKVYDILGREVATLVNENKIEGSYDFTFNASRFPSGVYIYQLRVNDYVSSKKMILLK